MRRYQLIIPIAIGLLSFAGASPKQSLQHDWVLVEGKHWMVGGGAIEADAVTEAREHTGGACPLGMVEVAGPSKLEGEPSIERLQDGTCTRWITRDYPQRCGDFDAKRWHAISADLPTKQMHFCADRFEYPNHHGAYPWISVTWVEAKAACATSSKRLCTEDEWTFACEGEEARPYPYGYHRDDDACVIDRAHRPVDEAKLAARASVEAMHELDRLWQGEASGSRTLCRSPLGVFDLTGNVDEWTVTTRANGLPSILKGG